MRLRRLAAGVALVGVASLMVVLWSMQQQEPDQISAPNVSVHTVTHNPANQLNEGVVDPEGILMSAELSDSVEVADQEADAVIEPAERESALYDGLASAEDLKAYLPEWLQEQGNLFHQQRMVLGHPVSQTRGRYEWPNGSFMEVEITDAGAGASATAMKALGFNLNQTNDVTQTGYTLTGDDDELLINQEYNFEDRSGSFQIILSGRYMVEVQLQNLPEDSFQHILDHQLSLGQLPRSGE